VFQAFSCRFNRNQTAGFNPVVTPTATRYSRPVEAQEETGLSLNWLARLFSTWMFTPLRRGVPEPAHLHYDTSVFLLEADPPIFIETAERQASRPMGRLNTYLSLPTQNPLSE
jgi:hypothetical protein